MPWTETTTSLATWGKKHIFAKTSSISQEFRVLKPEAWRFWCSLNRNLTLTFDLLRLGAGFGAFQCFALNKMRRLSFKFCQKKEPELELYTFSRVGAVAKVWSASRRNLKWSLRHWTFHRLKTLQKLKFFLVLRLES